MTLSPRPVSLTGKHGAGHCALVDEADWEWVSGYRWHWHRGRAARSCDGRKIFLHRAIVGLQPFDPRECHHRNSDRLDCQRSNLHVVTFAQSGDLNPACGRCITQGSECSGCRFRRRNPKASGDIKRKSKFGIDAGQYDAMVRAQRGVCAICGQPETVLSRRGEVQALSVDHDHATGALRGLLCRHCNIALGMMGDDPERLRAAASYLNPRG